MFGLVVRDRDQQEEVADTIIDAIGVEQGEMTLEPNVGVIIQRYGVDVLIEIRVTIGQLGAAETEEIAQALRDDETVTVAGRTLGPDEIAVRSENLVTDTIRGISGVSGALSVIGLLVSAYSASAMFASIRKSLNVVWSVKSRRPYFQQKLIDLAMVFIFGLILLVSVAGTITLRAIREFSDDALGPLSTGTSIFWDIVPFLLLAVFSFLLFAAIYRYVPATRIQFRDIWPGVLLATLLFEAMKNAFALYIANFDNFDVAFGALGGIMIFLVWVYATANIMLIGAEMASEYPRVRSDVYRREQTPAGPARTSSERAWRVVRGLFVHAQPRREQPQEPGKEHVASSSELDPKS